MQSTYAPTEFYSSTSNQSYQHSHPSNTGSMIPSVTTTSSAQIQHQNNLSHHHHHQQPQQQQQYWTSSSSSQHSPNQMTYGAYHHQSTESVYTMQSSTSSTDLYSHAAPAHNYGTLNESQDIYQYSPYSGDLLQPEEIFQMDQPIRSANVSSLNQSTAASPPTTLLDLGSGNVEQKSIVYHSDMNDAYYSLHDDNSTHSSHNNDAVCFYQNVGDGNIINAHPMDASTVYDQTTTNHINNNNYYCDTRTMNDVKSSHAYAQHSPDAGQQICMEFQNASINYAAANNNNNNNHINHNNNVDGNFKGHKRKAIEAFAAQQQHGNPYANYMTQNDFYDNSVEHHQPQHQNGATADFTNNHFSSYFSGEQNHDLVQLSNNYQMSIVNSH